MGRGAEHRDDVEQRAVAQRIVHDVEARPAPTARRTSRGTSAVSSAIGTMVRNAM